MTLKLLHCPNQFHLCYDMISKLCSPSCMHVQWNSLKALEDENVDCLKVCNELKVPLSKMEYDIALSSIKLRSAPGLDQIDYQIIFSLPDKYALLRIYNGILSEGEFPPQWKQSLVVLIPKSENTGIPPISLISCYLKLME